MTVEKLWGVYHANGGVVGELSYVVGKLRGTTHCGLCDITHGTVRKKDEWVACETELGLPIELVHLNEQPAALSAVTEGRTPAVVAQAGDDWSILLGPTELEACDGSVDCFRERLDEALAAIRG